MRFGGGWALKYAGWALFAFTVLFLFVLPALTSMMLARSQTLPEDFVRYIDFIEFVQSYLMVGLTSIWVFFVGSCFASFLNVVAWRVPRGRGILGSSQCPHCETKLSFKDNIPVVGWLRAGGECRTCKTSISPRYLIVELILGALFLLVVLLELVSGGMNLPLREPNAYTGFQWVLFDPSWDLVQITVYHLALVSILFTLALVQFEKGKQPWMIFGPFVLLGISAAYIWPAVLPVGWQLPAPSFPAYTHADPGLYVTPLAGLLVGAACGYIFRFTGRPERINNSTWRNPVFSLALCGLFLGWQAVVSVGLIYGALRCCLPVLPKNWREYTNESGLIGIAAILHISCWRITATTGFWPGPQSEWWQLLAGLAIAAFLVFASNQLSAGQSAETAAG